MSVRDVRKRNCWWTQVSAVSPIAGISSVSWGDTMKMESEAFMWEWKGPRFRQIQFSGMLSKEGLAWTAVRTNAAECWEAAGLLLYIVHSVLLTHTALCTMPTRLSAGCALLVASETKWLYSLDQNLSQIHRLIWKHNILDRMTVSRANSPRQCPFKTLKPNPVLNSIALHHSRF